MSYINNWITLSSTGSAHRHTPEIQNVKMIICVKRIIYNDRNQIICLIMEQLFHVEGKIEPQIIFFLYNYFFYKKQHFLQFFCKHLVLQETPV